MAFDDDPQPRQNAQALTRQALVARTASQGAGRNGKRSLGSSIRFTRVMRKAEDALLRVVCNNPYDTAARLAYGDIVELRSALLARVPVTHGKSVTAARTALWALYGAECDGPFMSSLVADARVEYDFTEDGVPVVLDGGHILATGAQARFAVAERLHLSDRVWAGKTMTPVQIDAKLCDREKFDSLDEALLESCQLASCHNYDADEEAELLVTEAAAIYRFLARLGTRYGPEDVARAEARRDALLRRLPGY